VFGALLSFFDQCCLFDQGFWMAVLESGIAVPGDVSTLSAFGKIL
jgi:hypothetical protein